MNQSPYPHPFIAREGWPFIFCAAVIALLVTSWSAWVSLPFWVIAIFVFQFFRDPARPIPAIENTVLSAADGRVVAVEQVEDPYTQRTAIKVSVFMNVFNVHSNRSPIDGKILDIQYFPGKFFNAALSKASESNERNAMIMQTPNDHLVTVVQIAGLIAKRILCYVKAGDQLTRGQRYGFIRFGSRVDIYLPLGSLLHVSLGDKVSASRSILAELPLVVENHPIESDA